MYALLTTANTILAIAMWPLLGIAATTYYMKRRRTTRVLAIVLLATATIFCASAATAWNLRPM